MCETGKDPRNLHERMADRAIASLLAYDALAGHGARSWAGAIEAWEGTLRCCPHCGDADPRIASKYRDGGRWIYHYGCLVGGPAWANPDYPWPTQEEIDARWEAISRIAVAEGGHGTVAPSPLDYGLLQMMPTPLQPKIFTMPNGATADQLRRAMRAASSAWRAPGDG